MLEWITLAMAAVSLACWAAVLAAVAPTALRYRRQAAAVRSMTAAMHAARPAVPSSDRTTD
jgi:hypothetical protein